MADEAKNESRYRNVHTARVGNLAPGEEGALDPENPGVKVAVQAGHLVAVGGTSGPQQDPGANKRVTDLEAENAELRRKLQELEARGLGTTDSKATVSGETAPVQVEVESHKFGEPGPKSRRG